MPADFSEYVDLRMHDASPTDIYLGAIELARLTLPEFSLRTGTVEDALFQAMSYMQMLSVAAINRLPSRIMEGVLKITGVSRNLGTRAVITVNVVLNEVTELTIPIGTTFRYSIDIGDGNSVSYSFMTTESHTIEATDIPVGETLPQAEIELTSQFVGLHILPATGGELICETVLPDLGSVSFVDYTSVGSNPEDDATYLSRCVETLRSFTSANITAQQIRAYVLTTESVVSRCKVYDLSNSQNVDLYPTPASPVTGNLLVYVYGIERFLTPAERSSISANIADRSVSGLAIEVLDMKLADDITIVVDVTVGPDQDTAAIEDAITEEIALFLSPVGFTSAAEGISVADISAITSRIPGVAYVTDISLTGGGTYMENITGNFVHFLEKGTLPDIPLANITVNITVADILGIASLE